MNPLRLAIALLFALAVPPAHSTILVRFETNLGAFDVELFDTTMPVTVANFLAYANSGRYDSTIIHRSTTYNPADLQIVQGGGFQLAGTALNAVVADPPIVRESGTTHLRGTIAMARGAAANSATSQFFFNLTDNPGLNGGYAVFGQVVGAAGLAAIDAIGAVPVYDVSTQFGAAFGELPLLQPSLATSSLLLVQRVVVPEPGTLALAAAGIVAGLGRRRFRPH